MFPSDQNLIESENVFSSSPARKMCEKPLTAVEKLFLLHVERGDSATVRRITEEFSSPTDEFNINCADPLNRSAFIIAIENGNIEMIKLLLECGIDAKDGLLHAINEEFVEAVEQLLEWEEKIHKPGDFYSWEKVDRSSSTFTADITPLILASHKNNYEIIKLLLDRGATLPVPHDAKCGCDECVHSNQTDSLRHLQARINAYRALTSPSLISLSSVDPLLTAFELSWDLRRLSRLETEFRAEYNEMRAKVENFAAVLLDHVKTSEELMILLNYDYKNPTWSSGERQSLERLKLAIKFKQKKFVSHPNVQQLLGTIWYEGVPGFRRKNLFGQIIQLMKLSAMFPVYCTIYMIAPYSRMGLFVTKPFVKFICHSSSYLLFLMLLGAASQRLEFVVFRWIGNDWLQKMVDKWQQEERGTVLNFAEWGVVIFVSSKICKEIKKLFTTSLTEYICDLWNIVDFITNMFYVIWLSLRMCSLYITWAAQSAGTNPWLPREEWNAFEPMLISEGAFAAAMIFSFLKLVHIFSVNPHLGPLQISLGRMIIDIVKFFFIYTLVLFAFGCGMNQLLWYYAALERDKCYHLPGGSPDFETNDKACTIWRRYANLFETSQSLFWASFGLIDLMSFELTGIKTFTRFWAMLMFGSYSVINIIVLLNMLIAMMSNSFQIISERADVEWKFARSQLWINYFEDGNILPPPFNILPNIDMFCKIFKKKESKFMKFSIDGLKEKNKDKHDAVVKSLLKRFVTAEQRKRHEFGITEDDVIEIRQDISSLRYEIIDILGKNGMSTPNVSFDDTQITGRKGKMMERRILKDFQIGTAKHSNDAHNIDKTETLYKLSKKSKRGSTFKKRKRDWNALVRQNTKTSDPIGSSKNFDD